MVYSISLILFFAFLLPFSEVSNAIPHLSKYTGEWLCNLATIIIMYGISSMTSNSLFISITKYIFIVFPLKARKIGQEKIEKIFFAIYLILPFVIATTKTITKDFESYNSLRKCFALSDAKRENTWKRFFLCNLEEMGVDSSNYPSLEMAIQTICVFRSVLQLVIASNIPEAFFYYKIFKAIKR